MFFPFLLARLFEPSTWAGLGAVAQGIHNMVQGNLGTGLSEVGAGLAGVLIPEARKK